MKELNSESTKKQSQKVSKLIKKTQPFAKENLQKAAFL